MRIALAAIYITICRVVNRLNKLVGDILRFGRGKEEILNAVVLAEYVVKERIKSLTLGCFDIQAELR